MKSLFILSIIFCLSVTTLVSGESKVGKTTRYWDCCKPSCAWVYKAPFNQPVVTCDKDGVTLSNSLYIQSGCTTGTAYTCNNNQPRAINASLSIGFAAANIGGQGESDWCCACYEVTFTNSGLEGKKLIVQATNTGGDLGINHFDLEMPGGGVGIYSKGCKDQWGAGDDGWGKRYGGLSEASECATMPKPLQSGCNWRFDWFKNADNPAMTFERVQCPKTILDITKCKRNDESTVKNAAYVNL